MGITTFIEYSETMPSCNSIKGNCAYEHHIYRSGYRYNGRVIGSTCDNDANTYTLVFIGTSHQKGHHWKANLRYLELNKNGSNKYQDPGGNQVSRYDEDLWNIDFSYIFPLYKWYYRVRI
ncbi:capsule assembly Wzi family protein [Vibrio astriarenae]